MLPSESSRAIRSSGWLKLVAAALWAVVALSAELPPNTWVELRKDMSGARRGSAIRYAPEGGGFFLWGFMNDDPDLLQEHPLMRIPEYDIVRFDLGQGRWISDLPRQTEKEWSRQLPLAYVPRTYSGITTGSERTVMRGASDDEGAVPRPDLNIAFDQVVYHPPSKSLIYFTGGLTAAYDVVRRRWSDLRPGHAPPPVLGGSLAYDPARDRILLFGGGHIAEQGPKGEVRGFTGTWEYSTKQNDWRQLALDVQPPPRMNTRMVFDSKNAVLVLFGGDSQTHYLADTWIFDLKGNKWRQAKATAAPPGRAGHYTLYDPVTGWVMIGGGYNRRDLTDMWAYDVRGDKWRKLPGETPTGFYVSGDIAPERKVILMTTNTRRPEDRMTCNVLFPVRTTYAYRIDLTPNYDGPGSSAPTSIPKQDPGAASDDPARARAQAQRLSTLPENRWLHVPDPGRAAPTRTWGSATFDTRNGQILYWGGGHCGYEGNDVDAYDVAGNTWRTGQGEFPERLWNRAARLAGVTFKGGPWTEHGRRVYAYDPVRGDLIMARSVRLTSGYDPEWLRKYPSKAIAAPDALVSHPSSYVKYVTWSYDLESKQWRVIGPAPAGLDTLVSTPQGVMGVNVNWPARLNDVGYQRLWRPSDPPEDNALFALRRGSWVRVSKVGQPSPQNLYEMTSLAFDSKRGRMILHGAGAKRDELWTCDLKTGLWKQMQPKVLTPGSGPPACSREAVYLPDQDVFLTTGSPAGERQATAMWAWKPGENTWTRMPVEGDVDAKEASGQNRAMVYDPKHRVVFLVLGKAGDDGTASVYALRYRHPVVK